MKVKLNLVTIRNGRNGQMFDVASILAGREPLMARSKVRIDANFTDDDGNGVDDPPEPDEIKWEFGYNGSIDLSFLGDTVNEKSGSVWTLGGQGVGQLIKERGHTVVVKYDGAEGSGNAFVMVSAPGVAPARIDFPWSD